MMTDFLQARTNMVDSQIHTAGVVDSCILESFGTVPRELFVPERFQTVAYADETLDIGQGRFLLAPMVYAKMLAAARLLQSDIVLDIGVGSGYCSAILSPLVTTIIALEHHKHHMDKATKLWNHLGVCNVALLDGVLQKGQADHAPYSLIIINGSVSEVPVSILDQLDDGGRLMTIVKEDVKAIGQATLFQKSASGDVSSLFLFDAAVPFLEGFEPQNCFEF